MGFATDRGGLTSLAAVAYKAVCNPTPDGEGCWFAGLAAVAYMAGTLWYYRPQSLVGKG